MFFRAILSARFSAFDLRGFFFWFFCWRYSFAMGKQLISKRARFPQKPCRLRRGIYKAGLYWNRRNRRFFFSAPWITASREFPDANTLKIP